MYKQRRKQLSQNFLYNRKLLYRLVGQSSISNHDLVLDIGAGKGILTSILAQTAKRIIAIELDDKLVLLLHRHLDHYLNVTIINSDFLAYPLPTSPYKVFANIPFSIGGQIVRKLMNNPNPPQDCYLVVRTDLAKRLSGAYRHSQFSLMHKPWFEFSLIHHFNHHDFTPSPSVNCCLWRIHQRPRPIIPHYQQWDYQRFVTIGFGQGDTIKRNFRQAGIQDVATNLSAQTKPTDLTFDQWLNIWRIYRQKIGVSPLKG